MAKPSKYITWTDGDSAKQIEPSSGQKLTGWVLNQAPPFEYMNWLFYLLDLWIQWLDSITTPANLATTVTGTTTAAYPMRTYFCNPTGGAFTLTLPAASSSKGIRFCLKHVAFSSGNNVTVGRTGTDLLENGTSATLGAGENQVWESDGTNWYMVAGG